MLTGGRMLSCAWCFKNILRPQIRVLISSTARYGTQSNPSVFGINPEIRKHLEILKQRYQTIVDKLSSENDDIKQDADLFKEQSKLEPLIDLISQYDHKQKEIQEYDVMISEKGLDGELMEMATADRKKCVQEMSEIESTLINALVPHDEADEGNVILEVRSGAGGREASLFTAEIFQMYSRYSDFKGWKFDTISCDKSDDGGYKSASASVTGHGAYGDLKFEGGVHRVQRVPATEALGRVHTSTMTVAVLPEPSEVDIRINSSDLKIETFRAGGAGGQHVNTTDSAVRITHIPSGITVKIQEERSQHQNRFKAMKLLTARLYDVQRTKSDENRMKDRKQQIGTGDRQEKIRTYNYNQDRVTDHRVGVTLHEVQEFLRGNHLLRDIIEELKSQQRLDYLTKTFN